MKYIVKHYGPNPANNSSQSFEAKKDAEIEAKEFYSDEPRSKNSPGASHIYAIGPDGRENEIGRREWNRSRISWS